MLNYGLEETIRTIDNMNEIELESFLNGWERIMDNQKLYDRFIEEIGKFGFFQYKGLVINHAKMVYEKKYYYNKG